MPFLSDFILKVSIGNEVQKIMQNKSIDIPKSQNLMLVLNLLNTSHKTVINKSYQLKREKLTFSIGWVINLSGDFFATFPMEFDISIKFYVFNIPLELKKRK